MTKNLSISPRLSSSLAYNCSWSSFMIHCISVAWVVLSPLSFLILCPLSFFLVSLAKVLPILYVFPKNQPLVSLIFSIIFLVFILFISALIFMWFFKSSCPRIYSLMFFKEKGERETSINCLPYKPPLRIKTATWVCALSGDQTRSFLMYRIVLQPAEPPSQGLCAIFYKVYFKVTFKDFKGHLHLQCLKTVPLYPSFLSKQLGLPELAF